MYSNSIHLCKIAGIASLVIAFASPSHAIEQTPIGSISALETYVATGEKATLDWQISYPLSSTNTSDTARVMTVKFITAAIGKNSQFSFWTALPGESPVLFYTGISEDNPNYALDSGTVVAETVVEAGESIELIAQHHSAEKATLRGQTVSTADSNDVDNIIKLKNGDAVPLVDGVGDQRPVSQILAPYSDNGVITIGEHEEIYLFELWTSNVGGYGFDLQDLVLLVSYSQVPLEN
ncbi:MAG: hypothetical protein ACSHX7_01215 [Luteolibacter sp.]